MEIFSTILKIILTVAFGVGVYFLCFAVPYLWFVVEGICSLLDNLVKLLLEPFKALWRKIKGNLGIAEGGYSDNTFIRFTNEETLFGTGKSIYILLGSIVFLGIVILVSWSRGNLEHFVTDTLSTFPLFFIFDLINGDVAFTLDAFVSTGICAMLISVIFGACMKDYDRDRSIFRWIVSVVYYIFTAPAACYLGFLLSGVWEWLTKAGISLYGTLKSIFSASGTSFVGILTTVGCGIALLLLLYIGIILIMVALKEYIETFGYGAIGFVIFIVIMLLCVIIGSNEFVNGPVGQVIMMVTLFSNVFVLDFMRVNKQEILKWVKLKLGKI